MAEFNLWLLILGIAAGAAVTWLVIGTIARNDDEVAGTARAAEATWIARTIEEHGGRAPVQLVEQILALHRRYLGGGTVVPVPQSEEGGGEGAGDEVAEGGEPEMEPETSAERDAVVEPSTPEPTTRQRRTAGTRKRAAGRTVR